MGIAQKSLNGLLASIALTSMSQSTLADDVKFMWNKAIETPEGKIHNPVVGYRIHYGTESGDYTSVKNVKNVLEYTLDIEEDPETIIYCAVTSYNVSDQESPKSAEISFKLKDLRKAPKNPTGFGAYTP